jgi:hypothetical protein
MKFEAVENDGASQEQFVPLVFPFKCSHHRPQSNALSVIEPEGGPVVHSLCTFPHDTHRVLGCPYSANVVHQIFALFVELRHEGRCDKVGSYGVEPCLLEFDDVVYETKEVVHAVFKSICLLCAEWSYVNVTVQRRVDGKTQCFSEGDPPRDSIGWHFVFACISDHSHKTRNCGLDGPAIKKTNQVLRGSSTHTTVCTYRREHPTKFTGVGNSPSTEVRWISRYAIVLFVNVEVGGLTRVET